MSKTIAMSETIAPIKIARSEKKILIRAAKIASLPVATFVRSVALKEARKIVAEQEANSPKQAA